MKRKFYLNRNKIRGLLRENNLSISDVAKSPLLGISVSSLNNKLTGKTDFTSNELCGLAEMFAGVLGRSQK